MDLIMVESGQEAQLKLAASLFNSWPNEFALRETETISLRKHACCY